MSDKLPEFEIADKKGSTAPYAGTVGTSWTAIPGSPGNDIQTFSVESDIDNPVTSIVEISLDGVEVLQQLTPGEFFQQVVKGSIQQIWLRGSVASLDYRVVLNREAS